MTTRATRVMVEDATGTNCPHVHLRVTLDDGGTVTARLRPADARTVAAHLTHAAATVEQRAGVATGEAASVGRN